jgi:hypothetical protein
MNSITSYKFKLLATNKKAVPTASLHDHLLLLLLFVGTQSGTDFPLFFFIPTFLYPSQQGPLLLPDFFVAAITSIFSE